jgi:hypothetical protein
VTEVQLSKRPAVREHSRFVRRVMEIFAWADAQSTMWWNERGQLFANVSDVFWWGTSDMEEITPATLPVLEQTFRDLKYLDETYDLAVLYAARIRKMRPQGAAYEYHSVEVQALLNECGPRRERSLTNPKEQP